MHFPRHLIALVATGLFATASMAMTSAEHSVAKERISAEYKASKAQCDALTENAKDVCIKQAKGTEDVAKAELAAQYKPSEKAHYKVRKARADADYAVAKEKCDDHSGNDKDVCNKDAKAEHVKAIENAKVAKAQATPANSKNKKDANTFGGNLLHQGIRATPTWMQGL